MKLPTILLTLLFAATLTSAWKLHFHSTDSKYVKAHGKRASGCITLLKSYTAPTKKIYWDPTTSKYPDSVSFIAYESEDCSKGTGLGTFYRIKAKKGDIKLEKPLKLRSYKVDPSGGIDVCKS
ncbi:hypothetical protein AJ80_09269 [Polytolypa hystricis UAMH7299]|uniref:Uncharacterized protein n=1 Tax=Polytolypa hystricis (strain UAMH7299) TaxID=1447883 RepID=A0A2B7WTB3_POLH7|nr:hypothetical protein AJ80_09269 [Polytolypa hystricis UAMH7299]